MKMDLTLNNQRWLIYHKTKPNIKIQEKFVYFIFKNRLWFACMVKFQSLAKFPVDNLSHPLLYFFSASFLHSIIIW